MVLNHRSHMLRRAIDSTSARQNLAGLALSQHIQIYSSFYKLHCHTCSIKQSLRFGTTTHLDTGDGANGQWPVKWSRISGGCGCGSVEVIRQDTAQEMHPGVNIAKGQLRAQTNVLSPPETDMMLPMFAAHQLALWLERQSEESAEKNPDGKHPTVVSPGHRAACRHASSVWRARPFILSKAVPDTSAVVRNAMQTLAGYGVPDHSLSLCNFFHRKENLGCVSGSPASLEHAIFCPVRLETWCLGQKVWVSDWTANDPQAFLWSLWEGSMCHETAQGSCSHCVPPLSQVVRKFQHCDRGVQHQLQYPERSKGVSVSLPEGISTRSFAGR